MKKTMLKAALLAVACCAVGAVCVFGACGDSGTFDEREPEASDYANFKTYMTDTLAYDGSFTIAFNCIESYNDEYEHSLNYIASYDSENGKAYMLYNEYTPDDDWSDSDLYYFVKGTDSITRYYDSGSRKSASSYSSSDRWYSDYAKYFSFYDFVTQLVDDPSNLSTEADVNLYIVEAIKKIDRVEFSADDLSLTVKGEDGSIYYIVNGDMTESGDSYSYVYSTTMQVIFTDGVITGVTCYFSDDYYRDDELYSSDIYEVDITVSYEYDSSVEWPENFDDYS
ncbi:MAG: hypothetical protein LUE27_08385 [Clostridia bacterium]|nr:hypothetical protein [Clostridia bacterium]